MNHFNGYVFDLDGTIYLGKRAIEGAPEVIDYLQKQGKKVLFLTNKTIESRERYVKKLNGFGIKATLENILNPTVVLIQYLIENYRNPRIYVIGEEIIKNELLQAGFTFTTTPEETDIVVVSWDREFHYSHLDFAYQAIQKGAISIATNPDRTCPMEVGELPDCGSMIGAIEGATGKSIDLIIGKPSRFIVSTALKQLNLEPQKCIMLGDRLETDIRMGIDAGMQTALVLSGVTKKEDLSRSLYQPTYVLESVYDLIKKDVDQWAI